MNQIQNTYRQHGARTWRERWMHRFGMDMHPLSRKVELSIPNWITGKSMVFFFVALFACWLAFGYVPFFDLWIVAALSVVLFFYGGVSMSKSWLSVKDKQFEKNVFVAGIIVRFLWVLYLYFIFNPEHYGNTYGETADVDWYIPFGKDLAEWLSGSSKFSLAELIKYNNSAIDDVGYPMWLSIIYLIFGADNDIFVPFVVKCIVGSYCSICMYRVAKRHFGEGTARMAAIFVCLNPNMIYWCGSMFKEAEMVS